MWDMWLKRIFNKAKFVKCHAQRFRDTFAVALLLEGVPMERVSILLGHTPIRVTERHCAPWVRSRQEQLEADVSRVWSSDPLALLKAQSRTKGTPEVHGKTVRPNEMKTKTIFWCGRGDSNPHALRRHPLKMVRLPVPPLPPGVRTITLLSYSVASNM